MKFILIGLFVIGSQFSYCKNAWSYFGMSAVESTAQSIESVIDDVLMDSKLQESMAHQPIDFQNLRKALLKGAMVKKEVFDSLLIMKNETLMAIPAMPPEAHEKEYFFAQVSLRATAQDYGYVEELK